MRGNGRVGGKVGQGGGKLQKVGGKPRQVGGKTGKKVRNSILDGVASMAHHLFLFN